MAKIIDVYEEEQDRPRRATASLHAIVEDNESEDFNGYSLPSQLATFCKTLQHGNHIKTASVISKISEKAVESWIRDGTLLNEICEAAEMEAETYGVDPPYPPMNMLDIVKMEFAMAAKWAIFDSINRDLRRIGGNSNGNQWRLNNGYGKELYGEAPSTGVTVNNNTTSKTDVKVEVETIDVRDAIKDKGVFQTLQAMAIANEKKALNE